VRRLAVLLVGRGTVGSALAAQIEAAAPRLAEEGLEVRLVGVAGRREAAVEPRGFEAGQWRARFAPASGGGAGAAFEALSGTRPLALVDATAEAGMGELYARALEAGAHVVSCNKIPFTRSQREYDRLQSAASRAGRYLRFEATAGAGLPTLRTLRDLRQSGDVIEEVSGCFSGTLNFLCAGLDRGRRFSELVREARAAGFTEPDPREDLSGRDVARKALILARLAGGRLEPEQVACRPLADTDPAADVEAFLAGLESLDGVVERRLEAARRAGRLLRYVARATPEAAGCGPAEVETSDPLARLAGPENIFVYRTRRYRAPLVVSGPGAGAEVTAGGVFADLLEVARGAAQ
jgi:aspartokinase/homoserine dehydrogenase 1